ncbi:MAG: hypothetical protein JO362_24320, partial [Streptomycetaceae bacterium]|nr:hypothetical protein [Streptomycetaceae bacterium]
HAAHQLDLCASACHDLANDLTRDLTPAQPPKLSTAQYTALQALAKGWGCMRASHPRGSARIHTGDGTRITLATFQSLVKRGLVHWDTSTPLSRGQDINLTAQGQQALAHHQANKAPDTLPAPAPGSAVATTGMRR